MAVAEFHTINHWTRMPFYLGILADALARCAVFSEALDGTVDWMEKVSDRQYGK